MASDSIIFCKYFFPLPFHIKLYVLSFAIFSIFFQLFSSKFLSFIFSTNFLIFFSFLPFWNRNSFFYFTFWSFLFRYSKEQAQRESFSIAKWRIFLALFQLIELDVWIYAFTVSGWYFFFFSHFWSQSNHRMLRENSGRERERENEITLPIW